MVAVEFPRGHENLRRGFFEFMDERIQAGRWWAPVPVEQIRGDFSDYLKLLEGFRKGEGLIGDMVPSTELWIVEENEYIGRVNIRHRLNAKLEFFGGHIGYEIRKEYRRKGYGTLAMRSGLSFAKELGLKEVLVTCDEDNTGSIKIIERAGGVLKDKVLNEGRAVRTCRYRINV